MKTNKIFKDFIYEKQIIKELIEEYKALDQGVMDSCPKELNDEQLGHFYQGLAFLYMNEAKQFYLDANTITTLGSQIADELSNTFGIQAGAHPILAKIYNEESKKFGITKDSRILGKEGEIVKLLLAQHPSWNFKNEQ